MSIITKKSGVYEIRCLVNGKSYIGSSKNLIGRRAEHFRLLRKKQHPNIHLQRAWNKYGKDAFIFVVLEYCSEKGLLKREQNFMDKMDVYKCGFNLRPKAASNFGWKQSEEQKKNNSRRHKGQKFSEESKKRISKALKGRKFSKEHRKNLSEAAKKRPNGNNRKGVKLSEEIKKKISESEKGKVISEETRAKMSKARKGKKLSEEHKAKLRGRICSDSTKAKMTKSQRERWKHITKEQIIQRERKRLKANTHKERSEFVKRGWDTRRAKCAA